VAKKRKEPRRRPPTPEGISHTARGAVLVKFPEKPSEGIRKQLRDAGFHFNRGKFAWINKSTEKTEAVATEVWEAWIAEAAEDLAEGL